MRKRISVITRCGTSGPPPQPVAMGSLTKIVVFLYITSAVLCTPVINKLQEGQEWPTRSSVKQPQSLAYQVNDQREGLINETEDAITVDKALEDFFNLANDEEEGSENVPEKVSEKAPEKVSEKSPHKFSDDVPEKATVYSEEGPEKAPEEDSVKATEKGPEEALEEGPKRATEGHPEKSTEERPEKAPKGNPEKAPEERPVKASESRPQETDEGQPGRNGAEAGVSLAEEKVDYTGCQLWKVITAKNSDKKIINKLAAQRLISSWGGNQTTIDILIAPNQIENITSVFERNNIIYQIMINNLQAKIDEENPKLSEHEIELQDRRGHRMTWNQYHRIKDIHDFMDYLAKTYPSIVSVKTIGKSSEGRDLKILRISDGKPANKAVFIDGGIHAREWISPAVVTYFINQFAENFDNETEDIKNIDWYFLPVVNPDGYEYTHSTDRLWRKNRSRPTFSPCFGTDLNRNFGFHWGEKGSSKYPCSEIYRGSDPFSEPETKAISFFMETMQAEFSAYLTYHSYGQYLLYPWGYDNELPQDHEDLQNVGTAMATAIQRTGGSRYSVGSSSGLLYPASGGSDDWAKSLGVKYTFTIELSDTGRYGFVLPARFIVPVAKENLAGLRVLAHELNKELL